jgi:hypothetical protein
VRCIDMTDEEHAANLEISCVRGVGAISVFFEGHAHGSERFRRSAEVTRSERDFGLGEQTSGAEQILPCAIGTRGATQQGSRPAKIAELCHGRTAQRERRSIFAQRDALQCAERIAYRQRACGGGNQ